MLAFDVERCQRALSRGWYHALPPSRGFLNNTGNVDRSADVWQGEIRDPADPRLIKCQRNGLGNGGFAVIAEARPGIRHAGGEAVRLSRSARAPHGAPDHQHLEAALEDDIGAYVAAVAAQVEVVCKQESCARHDEENGGRWWGLHRPHN